MIGLVIGGRKRSQKWVIGGSKRSRLVIGGRKRIPFMASFVRFPARVADNAFLISPKTPSEGDKALLPGTLMYCYIYVRAQQSILLMEKITLPV